jgi:hypothetical protein
MFIDLPEGRWLVDTGSPATFGTPGCITWGGRRREVPRSLNALGMMAIGMDQIQPHIDMPIVGLLGADLLNEFDTCWDGPAGLMHLSPSETPGDVLTIPMESPAVAMGIPLIEVRMGSRDVICVLDTGAQYGYVLDERLVEGAEAQPRISDFNPILGAIDSPSWHVELDLGGGVKVTERVGMLGGKAQMMLGMIGVEAVIGCSWLPPFRVWFRPSRMEISLQAGKRPLSHAGDR